MFDNGRLFSGVLDDIFTKTYNNHFKTGDTAWMSKIAEVREQMETKVKDLNEVLDMK